MDTISKDVLGLILIDGGYFPSTYYPILRMVCKRWKNFFDGRDLPHIKYIFEMCLNEGYDDLARYLLKYKFKPKNISFKKIIKFKDYDIFEKTIMRFPGPLPNIYIIYILSTGKDRFLEYLMINNLCNTKNIFLLICTQVNNRQMFKIFIDLYLKYNPFVNSGGLYNSLLILYNPPHCDNLKYLLEKFEYCSFKFEKIYGKNLKGPDDIEFYKWLNCHQNLKKLIDFRSLIYSCLDKEYIEFLDWIASVKNLDLDRYKIKRDHEIVKTCIRNHKLDSLFWLLKNGFDVPPTFCTLLFNHRILGQFLQMGGETCTCEGKHHRIVNNRKKKKRKI